MGDYHVKMQFDIDAERAEVLDALTSAEGVGRWWSSRVQGDPGTEGESFKVFFPEVPEPFRFEVVESSKGVVAWRQAGFPPWWDGTTIRFDLSDAEEGTRLLFSHRDFDPDNEVIPIITPAWAQILLRLKETTETGHSVPFFDF